MQPRCSGECRGGEGHWRCTAGASPRGIGEIGAPRPRLLGRGSDERRRLGQQLRRRLQQASRLLAAKNTILFERKLDNCGDDGVFEFRVD